MDSIDLGAVPCEEQCEQLGDSYNPARARQECRAFIDQLVRQFGQPPTGASLRIKSNPHDFGVYLEVNVNFDGCVEEAVEYAFTLEKSTPQFWDKEARKELSL